MGIPNYLERLPSEAMSLNIDGRFLFLENLISDYQTLQVVGRELTPYQINELNVTGADGTLI